MIALIAVALIGGIGITAIGPGGVLLTVGATALTPMAPSAIAGTLLVTHIPTGILGTAAFTKSGHLATTRNRRLAATLSIAALAGTPLGVWLNSVLSKSVFAYLLAALLVIVAVTLMWREKLKKREAAPPSIIIVAGVGLIVALIAGAMGLGGPMLAVPLLVMLGVPMLTALATAQVQSIVIASIGSIAYYLAGAISWKYVLILGAPQLLGVVLGWKVARTVPPHILQRVMIAVLIILAPYTVIAST